MNGRYINPGQGWVTKAAQPSSRTINWDVHLTQLIEGYAQDMDNFVGSRVFPVQTVTKESDRYWRYPLGTFNRHEMSLREEMGVAAKANFTISDDYFQIVFKALGHDISDRRLATARPPIMEDEAIAWYLTEQAQIDIEKNFSDTAFKTGVWNFEVAGHATADTADSFLRSDAQTVVKWDAATGSDPIANIVDAQRIMGKATGRRPTILVLGRNTYDKLRFHDDLVELIDAGQTSGVAKINKMNLSFLFELDEIFVMDAVENTAAEGKDADGDPLVSNAYIGDENSALLLYRSTRGPDMADASAGYTFVLKNGDLIPNAWDSFNDRGMAISRYYSRERRCETMEIDLAYTQKISGVSLGCFFKDIVG